MMVVIFPKLSRRLAAFIDNYSNYYPLKQYFTQTNEPLRLLPHDTLINFSDIIAIRGHRIQVKANR